MKTKTLFSLAALMPAALFGQSQQERPNIVIIEADDLGFGDLSCYGATAIKTPGMDRLAEEGLRFTDAFCTAATSTPSRYSLLTGKYPWSNKDAKILPGNAALIINTQQITLPKVLKQAGYATGPLANGIWDWVTAVWTGTTGSIREPVKWDMNTLLSRQPQTTGCHASLLKTVKE